MEIAGYEIDNKYLAAGAAGLGVIVLLANRNKGADPTIATLQPAEGLTWKDIIGQADNGKLIGPQGETGPPGLPGSGTGTTPCTSDSQCGSGKKCVSGVCVADTTPAACTGSVDCPTGQDCVNGVCRPRRGGGGGNKGECRRDNDCKRGEVCKSGKCHKDTRQGSGGGGRNDGGGGGTSGGRNGGGRNDGGNPDRPRMPDRNRNTPDPRMDDPRARKRRDDGNNRINRPNDNNPNRERDNARGGNVRGGDIRGNESIDVRGGNARSRGRNAHADARGGNVSRGNVDKNANVHISASGGTAHADARGGSGNSHDKRVAKRRLGRAGAAESWEYSDSYDDGFGREDGNGTDALGLVNTHPQSGGITGGFYPNPAPLAPVGERAEIKRGETLRGFAQRTLGNGEFWPRIVRLNNTYDFPDDSQIPAGTVFRIG